MAKYIDSKLCSLKTELHQKQLQNK